MPFTLYDTLPATMPKEAQALTVTADSFAQSKEIEVRLIQKGVRLATTAFPLQEYGLADEGTLYITSQ